MEALLATLVVIVLMVGALALLARTWPRTSRLGGYRAGGKHDPTEQDQERGAADREDDDTHWKWQ